MWIRISSSKLVAKSWIYAVVGVSGRVGRCELNVCLAIPTVVKTYMDTVWNGWVGTVNPGVIDFVVVVISKLTDSHMRHEQNPGQVKELFLWYCCERQLDRHGSSGRIHIVIMEFVCKYE